MKAKRILLLLLSLILLFTSVLIPTVYASGTDTDYDYSREGSYFNTVFTAADMLSLLGTDVLGAELSDGERAYLEKYSTFSVKYERIATTQDISVVTVDDITRVTAGTYTYAGSNGATVTWIPVESTVGDTVAAMTLKDGTYVAEFTGITLTDDASVDVKYRMTDITVKASDINNVLNLAYKDAKELALYIENEAEIDSYFASLELYSKYVSDKLVYDAKKSAYDKYLQDYAEYEEELAKHEDYLEALDKYGDDLDKYNSYDGLLEAYNKNLVSYNAYLADLAIAEAQIKMLDDALFSKVTYLDRQLYACLFAGLVDEVVEKRDQLTKIGAKAEDIDTCNTATANIRAILKPQNGVAYVDLKTTEEKYSFYVNNYEALRDNIIQLTKALHHIYDTDGVLATMHLASSLLDRPNYTEKLSIFIAQLVYFSNALSSETIMTQNGKAVLDGNLVLDYRDDNGVDHNNVSLYNILEKNVFVDDIANPKPITLVTVPEPTHPGEKPGEPTLPTVVAKPTEPITVENPGNAPSAVSEPTRPTWFPEDLTRLELISDDTCRQLVSDYNNGLLVESRDNLTEDLIVTPTVTLTKNLNVTDLVEVTFLDAKGDVITTVLTEKGTAVNYTSALPVKSEDITATYAFVAWVDADGNAYNLASVTENATLYPSYRPIYKDYPVVDNNGDKFLSIEGASSRDAVPLTHFLEVAKKKYTGIQIDFGDVDLGISYSAVIGLEQAGVTSISLVADLSSIDAYSCEVVAYTVSGEMAVPVSGITVTIPCDEADFGRDCTVTYEDADGAIRTAGKKYKDGMIILDAATNTHYSFTVKYAIKANSNVTAFVQFPQEAVPGETVQLTVTPPEGKSVQLYYTLPDVDPSTRYTIQGDSFVMPYGNVRLGATLTAIADNAPTYTVKFVSDGKVISEKRDYKYGDTVTVPHAPTKLSDAQYSYSFIGWSPEVTTVTGDVTYVAQFEATPLPVSEKKVSTFNIIFYSGVSVLALFVIGTVIFILDRKKVISVKGIFSAIGRKLKRKDPELTVTETDSYTDGGEDNEA